jgi:hypothetical protein
MKRSPLPPSFLAVALAFPFVAACLRRSLEVFNNDTGATTVFMGGAAP